LCPFEAVQWDGRKSTPTLLIHVKQLTPFNIKSPLFLKNCSNGMGDFKNLKSVGMPLFGPNLSFNVIIYKLFS
jgi:hypothetical protein